MGISQDKMEKYVGSCCGNRFVILDCRNCNLDRDFKVNFAIENIGKYKVDSALFIEKSSGFDALMEIFEKDGSESDSCGNGTILIAHLLGMKKGGIEMKDNAAMITSYKENQGIMMNLKFSLVEDVEGEKNCVYVKFGEPHIVYLVDDINSFDLVGAGERMQKQFPSGVNVDVVQKIDDLNYLIKTYERGVFSLTASCGTGSLSSYLAISHINGKIPSEPVKFTSSGGIHWISRYGNMLELKTLKELCEFRKIK